MKQIKRFFKIYLILVVLFVLQKPLFMLLTHASAAQPLEDSFSTMLAVIWHGLQLDLSMAGYLTAIPALLLLASIWIKEEIIRPVFSIYFGIIAVFMSFCFVLNIALYPYWNFPLDSTPLFYFFTSPADAFASTSIWVDLLGFICLILCAVAIWFVLSLTIREKKKRRYGSYSRPYSTSSDFDRHRGRTSIIMLLLTGLLFLPIRGGVTVSTANTGKVYFSQNSYVNHSAVNPMFSLMESLAHQENFAEQYRFMDEKEANKIFATMTSQSDETPIRCSSQRLWEEHPIYFS